MKIKFINLTGFSKLSGLRIKIESKNFLTLPTLWQTHLKG
jgi:hypothetical protein